MNLPAPPTLAVRAPDGTMWVETAGDVYRLASGAAPVLSASGSAAVTGVGWLDGRSAAIVIDLDTERPDEPDLVGTVAVEWSDGTVQELGPASGPEYGVGSVTIGAGAILEGDFVDLGEWFSYQDIADNDVAWFNPTVNAAYNAPPLYMMPMAGQTATDPAVTLTWIEAPDWDPTTETMVGGWTLVVADAVTGAERHRVDLGTGNWLMHGDFDGRFWVGTFDDTAPATYDEPYSADRSIVVDLQAPTPTATDLGCAVGVTPTIDRLDTPAPAAPPPTHADNGRPGADAVARQPVSAPTTSTRASTTTRSAGATTGRGWRWCRASSCSGATTSMSTVTSARAPRRRSADFQATNGLEVDGLVGVDTWTALWDGIPAGADLDGNGTVDPWELAGD